MVYKKRIKSLKLKSLLLLICLSISLTSCPARYESLYKDAQELYDVNSYDSSVYNVVDSLKLNPKFDKSWILLEKSLPKAIKYHEERIENLKLSTQKFKWDDISSEYNTLIRLNNLVAEILNIPESSNKEYGVNLLTVDYTQNLKSANLYAAEEHYNEGLELRKNSDRELQKKAAQEFSTASKFVPNYKDSTKLYNISRTSATKRITILKFDDKTTTSYKYGVNVPEILVEDVLSKIINDFKTMEFLDIISRDEVDRVLKEQAFQNSGFVDDKTATKIGNILGVQELVIGQITQISYSPERTTSVNIKEMVRMKTGTQIKYTETGTAYEADVYGNIPVVIRKYSRNSSASIRGSYKIIDVKTSKVKKTFSSLNSGTFNDEWAELVSEGMDGASSNISFSNSSLLRKTQRPVPTAEDLINDAISQLSNDMVNTLKFYYN